MGPGRLASGTTQGGATTELPYRRHLIHTLEPTMRRLRYGSSTSVPPAMRTGGWRRSGTPGPDRYVRLPAIERIPRDRRVRLPAMARIVTRPRHIDGTVATPAGRVPSCAGAPAPAHDGCRGSSGSA